MAFPTILVDSATGSDSLSSGAGPATAVNGTAASVGATATSVSITDAVDLSGVATDGSACLYYIDSTAGHRNFDRITGVSGSSGAWTVTVANGFSTTTGPFSWAIGGKRASIGSASSRLLFDNNSAAGDAMPGWTIQLEDGHSETLSAELIFRRAGNSTSGPIYLQGAPGFTTRPLLTFSNNGRCLSIAVDGIHLKDFEMQNTNASKTSSEAIAPGANGSSSRSTVRNVKISDATNNFWRAVGWYNSSPVNIIDCDFGHCAESAIGQSSGAAEIQLQNCWVHDCTSHGVSMGANSAAWSIFLGNIFSGNGGDGINDSNGDAGNLYNMWVIGNTFYNNTSSGINSSGRIGRIANNIFSNNGAYGINLGSLSDAALRYAQTMILNNDFYSNTSGKYNPSTLGVSENEQTANPTFTNAAGNDFSIGTNLKSKGYPLGGTLAIGQGTSTYSYVDPGAAQRQETGGGGIPNTVKVIQNIGTY